jgi:hypothetical protein
MAITCALATVLSALVTAQTVTVDLALDDFMDFGGAQRVADLPGPDGHVTLREAVTATNNTPGAQTIAFAIPTSQWSFFYSDRALIRLDNMIYVSDDDTTIDFSTQAIFTGDTNLLGGEVALQYAGPPAGIPSLWIAATTPATGSGSRATGTASSAARPAGSRSAATSAAAARTWWAARPRARATPSVTG